MTASVAAETSAVKLFGVTATAVKHTPLTAMLPPIGERRDVHAAELDDEPRDRAPWSVRVAIRPMPLTNPENTRISRLLRRPPPY